MCFNHLPGEVQSQPKAGLPASRRTRPPEELIEETLLLARGDAITGVGHADDDGIVYPLRLHQDFCSGWRVTYGVIEQVPEHLAD